MSAFDPIPSIALDLQERFRILDDEDYAYARLQTIADVIKRNLNNYTLTPIAAEPIHGHTSAMLSPDLDLSEDRIRELEKPVSDDQFALLEKYGLLDNGKTYDENLALIHASALRAIVKLLDGSQPKDVPGALMVAQSALGITSVESQHGKDSTICRICTGGKACEHCKGVKSMQVDGGAAL